MNKMPSPSPAIPGAEIVARFAAIVGERYAVTDPTDQVPYLREWRDLFTGRTSVVLRPGSTEEVSAILKLANELGVAVVPQGGNTGLVGGQIPDPDGREIVISLGRLDKVREIDLNSDTMTVEAGVTLERIHEEALAVERMFPLTLASQGTCQIGGNLSSNAGGTAVLAYGNARSLALGLEVVLPTGEIWNGLRKLHKDNTGYDLKHLFIGAEGTLGIITAAVLQLQPAPKSQEVAFAGLASPEDALKLLQIAKQRAGRQLTAFELMPRIGLTFAVRHAPGARSPLEGEHEWYVLTELTSGRSAEEAQALLEEIFTEAFEAGIVEDAAVAQSLDQAASFWKVRHALSEVQKHEGGSIKHDVSVPVALIPTLLERGIAAVTDLIPGCRPVPFGHMGDGNIHFNISQPVGADKEAFLARWDEANTVVHAIVAELDGSISAEHGIGRLKRDLLPGVKSPVELEMMRRIKATFDPNGILNPGRIL
ncbi:MAG: hydroxyacid dehydrogenase [Hyphomicrobiales bacterium]|nr:MAG: hydroxyacid dehydrogenase [Hyphomicrobiales bacterium]